MAGLELAKKNMMITNSRRRWVLVLGGLGFSVYGAYKIYNLPSVAKKRERLFKLIGALVSLAEMVSALAEAIGILSNDLKEFIQTDSNQIPRSLKQISKLTQSDEFSDSLTRITRALTVGILSGYRHQLSENGSSDFPDRILDKLFSNAGCGFASIVVGSFSRNLVLAFCSGWQQDKRNGFSNNDHGSWKPNPSVSMWIEAICDHYKCRELIADCVQQFVSTAVTVYLDKTVSINTYNELFSGLTNPKHEAKMTDMMASVCNNAVETFIRTSHEVLTTDSADALKSDFDSCSKVDFDGSFSEGEKTRIRRKLGFLRERRFEDQNDRPVSNISSTLSVPTNRRFVLNATGTVAFETVRSFLEFSLEKISVPLKRSFTAVEEELVDRGLKTLRYVSGKTSSVTAMCITLCLNILNSPWILAPH